MLYGILVGDNPFNDTNAITRDSYIARFFGWSRLAEEKPLEQLSRTKAGKETP